MYPEEKAEEEVLQAAEIEKEVTEKKSTFNATASSSAEHHLHIPLQVLAPLPEEEVEVAGEAEPQNPFSVVIER